ncbi:phage GP46 family protein [Dyella lutea]|uniref:Phage GP46 family protein n=1 Tax=Dyella lutea TaxID=2950441 RepID=A0ABT1FIP2_9GAMM|nr:phage GP46 family protein [Dyella lutea]MCP1376052.1 phage GP46 family protein [Dyella lutea]
MTDITTTWDVANSRGDWSISGGALQSGDDITTAALISLFTDRQATASDPLPDASGDRRGWWGDLDEDVPIGSRLWILSRSKLTQQVALAAKGYMAEALQWLIDDGVAASVEVTTAIQGRSQLAAVVVIKQSNGQLRTLQFNWAWDQLA